MKDITLIHESALTLDVSFHRYAPVIKARELAQLASNLGVDPSQARGSWDLILEEFTAPLQRWERVGRDLVARHTIAVGTVKVLPTANFFRFQKDWRAWEVEWDRLTQDFKDRYRGEILPQSQAKFHGHLPIDKWADLEALDQRIRLNVQTRPFGAVGQIANLKHLDDQVKAAMEETMKEEMKESTRDVHVKLQARLSKTLRAFIAKMSTFEEGVSRVSSSIVGNVKQEVEDIPFLQVTEDPDLMAGVKEAAQVAAWDVDVLKGSLDSRNQAIEEANDALVAMKEAPVAVATAPAPEVIEPEPEVTITVCDGCLATGVDLVDTNDEGDDLCAKCAGEDDEGFSVAGFSVDALNEALAEM